MPDELTPNLELFSDRLAEFYDRSKFEITQVDELTKIEIQKLPDLSEGKTLIEFCRHQKAVCQAAIDCGIEKVQLTCGAIEYTCFNPAKLLPLLILNGKMLAAVGITDD